MNLKLGVKLGQQLSVTPKLQQSIKMMQLGRLDFIKAIEAELLENPVLTLNDEYINSKDELAESNHKANSDVNQNEPFESSSYNTQLRDDFHTYKDRNQNSNWLENLPAAQDPLLTLIAEQIDISTLDLTTSNILSYILGNLDESGFLAESDHEIATACHVKLADVLRAFEILNLLDPVGLGSRNMQECLLLQLDNMGLENSLAANIIKNYLDKLAKQEISEIAKLEKVPLVQVNQAVEIIKRLKPIPGNFYSNLLTDYVVPDVFFEYEAKEDSFRVLLNEDGLPRLEVSPLYSSIVREQATNEEGKYLKGKLTEANWLLKSIEQRRITLRRVSQALCELQKEFLLHGKDFLKPLTMKELANRLGVHESTISRIANQKYAATPQGLIELKYFFCQAISSSSGDLSAVAVKRLISNLVQSEPAQKPISDQHLVSILKIGHNLEISRRTVAKYREELGIPASHLRKRLKAQIEH